MNLKSIAGFKGLKKSIVSVSKSREIGQISRLGLVSVSKNHFIEFSVSSLSQNFEQACSLSQSLSRNF